MLWFVSPLVEIFQTRRERVFKDESYGQLRRGFGQVWVSGDEAAAKAKKANTQGKLFS